MQIEVKSLSQLRMQSDEVVTALRRGTVDFGEVLPTYVSEEIPIIEGVGLPGLFDSLDKTEQAHKAWQGVLKQYEKEMGGFFLGSTTYQKEYIFSASPIMIPVSSGGVIIGRTTWTDGQIYYLKALLGGSATPVQIRETELYTAIERGIVTKAISGSFTGYKLKLYEPCLYLIDLQFGTTFGVLVVGQKFWSELPEDLQEILIELGAEFTQRGFSVAQKATLDGIENNKNSGMLWIPTKPEWVPIIREVVMTRVVPEWINRSGPDAENLFNDFLAPYAGFTAHAADLTPPVISGVTISEATDSSATIIWTTDEESTSQVEYWVVSTNKFNTTLDEELVTSHSVTLDGLDLDITYKFNVKSKDASGNEATKGGSFNLQYLSP